MINEKTKPIKKLRKPASAALLYTVISAMERGSSVLFAPIYTRLLLPEEYGTYSLFLSFMGIVSVFATLEISGSAVYRAMKEFRDEKRISSAAIGLISLSSILTLGVYLAFSSFVNSFSKLTTYLTLILFLQAFLNGVRAIKISVAKFTYDKRIPLFEGIFFSLVSPTLSIVFLLLFENSEYAKIYAALLASFIFAAPILFSAVKYGIRKLFDKKIWLFLIKYSLPTLPHFLSITLIWQIGKITVANNFSAAETALLALAISVGLVPSVISQGIQSAMIPWITRRLCEGSDGKKKIYSLLLTAFSPLCILITLFLAICPELFRLLSAKEYYSALNAVYPIALSLPLVFLSAILSSEISHYKKTVLITLGSVAGMIFNLVCNLLFTFKLGFVFSAFIIVPTFFIINAVYALLLKFKFYDRELPFLKLFLIFFAFCVLVSIAFFLKISVTARILFSLSLVMMLLPKLKDIKDLCKE